jgi:hypothetical protein
MRLLERNPEDHHWSVVFFWVLFLPPYVLAMILWVLLAQALHINPHDERDPLKHV